MNAALLSRSKVYVLKPLSTEAIRRIVARARDRPRARAGRAVGVDRGRGARGDRAVRQRRRAHRAQPPRHGGGVGRGSRERQITAALIADLAQNRALLYDKTGEEHYNLISALHKSMRNSDPDASVYWLARMLEAGEDPLYVARRLVRFASEDIGNADPQALSIAVAAQGRRALRRHARRQHRAGAGRDLPGARRPRATPCYVAYLEAAEAAAKEVAEPVPLHLRNAPTGLMKQLDYGKGYRYAHDEPEASRGHGVPAARAQGPPVLRPTDRGREAR